MKHIEFPQLIEKFEGTLADAEVRAIEAHLSTCPKCAAEAGKLEGFFSFAEPHALEDVPQAVTARLLNIYQRPLRKSESVRRRIPTALLIFDDWNAALNERYSFGDSRQFLYRIGAYDVDLRLSLRENDCSLSGQIFPDCAGGTVELVSETASETISFNENCEFEFEPVPHGIYRLLVTVGEDELVIDDLPLRN